LNEIPPSYDPRRFRSAVPYYARFRLGYPDSLLARVAAFAGLRPGDRVLDLGCGPGLLAVGFARLGMHVVAVDPEPDMVAAARSAALDRGLTIDVREGSSFALPVDAAPFSLVAMGRSFHWMDGANTLRALDTLVSPSGALAFFDDDHPRTRENAWRFALRDVADKFGRNRSHHLVEARKPEFRSHHALLLESPFCRLDGLSTFVRRTITADEVAGLAFSLSTTSRAKLGDRADAFESELRAALAHISPEGQFVEIAELSALVARREELGRDAAP